MENKELQRSQRQTPGNMRPILHVANTVLLVATAIAVSACHRRETLQDYINKENHPLPVYIDDSVIPCIYSEAVMMWVSHARLDGLTAEQARSAFPPQNHDIDAIVTDVYSGPQPTRDDVETKALDRNSECAKKHGIIKETNREWEANHPEEVKKINEQVAQELRRQEQRREDERTAAIAGALHLLRDLIGLFSWW